MWDDFYATWDIWRTDYPLMLLLQPEVVRGTIHSFEERLRVDGVVRDSVTAGAKGFGPELAARPYTHGWSSNLDQGGNDIDNIIADAYVKGLKGVDWDAAYKNFCAAEVAAGFGETEEARRYSARPTVAASFQSSERKRWIQGFRLAAQSGWILDRL